MSAPRPIEPLAGPPDTSVVLPGSKSLTNRALVCALLAVGDSRLRGVLRADDTDAMITAVSVLGATVGAGPDPTELSVGGVGGALTPGPLHLDVAQAGTVARFLPAAAALGQGAYRFDGHPQMRARPMAPLLRALEELGASIEPAGAASLPFTVEADGLAGGGVDLPGDVSSQFVSALMLAGPATARGVEARLTQPVVSRPYLEMTAAVMAEFGCPAEVAAERVDVPPGRYRACDHRVEPDASAASYFFAAAAITGGRVTVQGLGSASLQGDLRFVEVLERMGAEVSVSSDTTDVRGPERLRGVTADLRDLSDTVPTLAVVAAFADGPTTITGVGFVRAKESDRIGAVVTELRRCGIDAQERDDGLEIRPGEWRPAEVQTYQDHRMAMAFAVAGLVVDGLRIADPDCVTKTFPGFWTALDQLRD